MQSQLGEDRSDRSNRNLLELSPIGLALCRADGTFLDVNPAFASTIGRTVAETIKLNYWEILQTDCADTKKDRESLTKNSSTRSCAAAYKHKNNYLVPVRVSQRIIETEGESAICLSAEEIFNIQNENSEPLESTEHSNSNLEKLLAKQTAELAKTQELLQQKNAELKVAKSQLHHHSQILDQIRESVICTDIDGYITSWNQASERLYGYQEDWVIGKHISIIYPPQQQEFLLEQVIKPLQKKGDHEVEIITCRKSGEQFESHLSLSLLKDKTGEVIGMVGYLTDISARKALEEELALKKALFDAFLQEAPAGLCILDSQLRYVQINQFLAEINCLTPAECIGKTVREILPHIASIVEPLYEEILRTKTPLINIEMSSENPRMPGVVRHMTGSYFPLLDRDGEAIGIGALVIDISDRKQAEAALEKSEQLYRMMASNIPNGAVMLFDKEMRYTLVEGTELAEMGLSKELMEGKTIWEVFESDFCRAIEPNYRAALAGETVVSEFTYRDRIYLGYTLPVRNERQEISGGLLMAQNITDRHVAEEALRESEEKYRCIVETADEGIWTIDAEGKTTFVNQTMADMLACTVEEMLGQSLFAFMDAEGIAIAEANLTRRREGINEKHDFKFLRRDGSDLWAMVSTNAFSDKEGRYVGALAMVADITARKQTEAALQQSEAKFRSLYELTTIAVFMSDENSIYDVNNATLKLFGYTEKEQFIGNHPGKLSPPFQPNGRDSSTLASEMMDLAFERGNHRFDWLHQRSDGTEFLAEVVLTAIEVGNQKHIQAVVQDLTDRQLAEETLVRSEQALRQQAQREQLLNQIANQIRNSLDLDTILATAVQEIRNLMRLDWCVFIWYRPNSNPPMWQIVCEAKNADLPSLLGTYAVDDKSSAAVQQILGRKIMRVDDVSLFEDVEVRAIFQLFKINSVLSLPVHTASGDIGTISCYQAVSARHWSDSEVELMQAVTAQIAIAIDHAELYTQTRTAAELARAQTQHLEQTLHQLQRTQTKLIQSEKMSSLGQLVAGVAHEINNPVNFIYGNLSYTSEYTENLLKMLQLYEQEYPQPPVTILEAREDFEIDYLIEDLPKMISSMKLGADRIRDIVLSLRTFSRLDEAEMKQVDIHEGIESTLLILQNRLKNKPDSPPINIVKEYGNLPLVECYPGQLNQVFMNLLTNAIDAVEMEIDKFNPTGKNLTITIRTEVTENNCVAMRITDSGPGMSEDVQQRLFDPFFTTKPVGKGTGLGLAISHSIVVEKHGGQLSCNSVVGEGAEFAIEIPLRQKRS
ncbi:PAS domain S-box protein [Tychonema sp. LEGE 07199]|uniref:PAS domain S-box protein n=1 Tax=unclassified Tychonema TaxID=2642144 RepID=UPI001880380C|nr:MULTISPECIES: PAS domain S-box protein [unclassified Tychonema]MBE9120695.1 PAS domain S-box protein [Tychonema sp. LEGE 07199]MBE9133085.1 PAS domain S-box protein [Tychonema sp. LEGE 07196]